VKKWRGLRSARRPRALLLLLLLPLYAALHLVDACLLEGSHSHGAADVVAAEAGDSAQSSSHGDAHSCGASSHGTTDLLCAVAGERRTQPAFGLAALLLVAIAAWEGNLAAAAIGSHRRSWELSRRGINRQPTLISLCVSLT
jgi:hypothetical protein